MTTESLDQTPAPTICAWMGRNIQELSEEELLVVVKHLARKLEDERENHQRTLRMWELCRKSKG
jgi:hypothetical protein